MTANPKALYKVLFQGTEHFEFTDLNVQYPIKELDEAEYWADELRANADGDDEEVIEVVELATGDKTYLACVVSSRGGDGVPDTWRSQRFLDRGTAVSFCNENRFEDDEESLCEYCGVG